MSDINPVDCPTLAASAAENPEEMMGRKIPEAMYDELPAPKKMK